MQNSKQSFSIDKKLQAMRPFIDVELYYQSIDYRRKVIFSFKQQERMLEQLKQEFSEQEAPKKDDEFDCVLGYN